jgi:hypothetical protein
MRIVSTIFMTVTLTLVASAQELSMFRSTDTLTLRNLVFPKSQNSLWQTQSFLPLNPSDSASMANLPAGFLRSQMLSRPMMFEERFDLASSLKLQWKTEDRFQLLRSALGYVLVGGEAYMVYRALEKYRYIR